MKRAASRHGTYSGFTRHYKRDEQPCDPCKEAGRTYRAQQRARRLASGELTHGLRATYDCGCRCDACKACRSAISRAESTRRWGLSPMLPSDERHGSYAGFQRHSRVPEKPCEPCRLAANEYRRTLRATAGDQS